MLMVLPGRVVLPYRQGMLSVSMRSDWGYLETDETEPERREIDGDPERLDHPQRSEHRQRTASYYVEGQSHGEPPGQWWGRGAESLGLTGTAVGDVMETVYGRLEDPTTGEALGSRPRKFASFEERLAKKLTAEPHATPERIDELRLEARKSHREARNYADLCFSPAKSWSVLHASLEAAGRHDEAAKVWEAWMDGVHAGLEYLMDEAGYSRAGYHGAQLGGRTSGEWVDAHDFVVSLWRHHTSRDGDPQLHVHAAVLNRVRCADGVWRSLDSKALHAARPAAGAIAERVAEEALSQSLGVSFQSRGDNIAREIKGITPEMRDLFSSRRREVVKGVEALAQAYREKHLAEPRPYDLRLMSEFVTLTTRQPKAHRRYADMLEEWEAKTHERFGKGLDVNLEAAKIDLDAPAPMLTPFDRRKVIALAIADVEGSKTVWNRHDLIASINRFLPDSLGGANSLEVRQLLKELATEAVQTDEVTSLSAPELIVVPDELRRQDGRSRFEPHDPDRYASTAQLSREERLIARAQAVGAPKVSLEEANRLIKATKLLPDQAQAVREVLTSGRWLEVLVGPAGTGKSFTVGQLADMWQKTTGGAVVGLTTSQNAANVLADEGLTRAANIKRFLDAHKAFEQGKGSRRQKAEFGLSAGDLVVVDETSMVKTEALDDIRRIAEAAGAKVLATGDPAQLTAPGAGGAMGLLVRQVGAHELTQVLRFDAAWEQEASLRLRDGDDKVLFDYDRRGRLIEGTAEQMANAVAEGFLADYLAGRQSIVVVGTNEAAAELSSKIRSQLVDLGKVDARGVTLHDKNLAGPGDLIQARRNDQSIDGGHGPVTNRQIHRVLRVGRGGALIVQRQLGKDDNGELRWGPNRVLPGYYVSQHVELAYASTAHASQGRTVDTSHLLADSRMDRRSFYVGMTRGRLRNIAYAVTDKSSDRISVLSSLLERQTLDPTALETLREEYQASEHLGRRGPVYSTLLAESAQARYEKLLADLTTPELAAAVGRDDAAGSLYRLLRSADAEGKDAALLLATAVATRELASAESVAQVLHHRVTRLIEHQERQQQAVGAIARVLGADVAEKLRRDPETPALWRLVRQAELQGSDRLELLRRAAEMGSVDDARSVANVLHWRVVELTKNGPVTGPTEQQEQQRREAAHATVPEPEVFEPKRCADAVPEGDDARTKFMREVAEAMDRRASGLGEAAAANPPAHLGRLGPVPDEPLDRQEWIEKAAAIEAYREQFGHDDRTEPIGRAPGRGDPDRLAAWEQAYRALGSPAAARDVAKLTDGELELIRTSFEREEQWAPPNVDKKLRTTSLELQEQEKRAAFEAAQVQLPDRSAAERQAHAVRAERAEKKAEALRRRVDSYEEVAGVRSAWNFDRSEARKRYEAVLDVQAQRKPAVEPEHLEPQAQTAPRPDAAPRLHVSEQAPPTPTLGITPLGRRPDRTLHPDDPRRTLRPDEPERQQPERQPDQIQQEANPGAVDELALELARARAAQARLEARQAEQYLEQLRAQEAAVQRDADYQRQLEAERAAEQARSINRNDG